MAFSSPEADQYPMYSMAANLMVPSLIPIVTSSPEAGLVPMYSTAAQTNTWQPNFFNITTSSYLDDASMNYPVASNLNLMSPVNFPNLATAPQPDPDTVLFPPRSTGYAT